MPTERGGLITGALGLLYIARWSEAEGSWCGQQKTPCSTDTPAPALLSLCPRAKEHSKRPPEAATTVQTGEAGGVRSPT